MTRTRWPALTVADWWRILTCTARIPTTRDVPVVYPDGTTR